MMEKASILAGKCYRDGDGVVYEVVSYDGDRVRFVAHPGAGSPSPGRQQGSEPWRSFLQKLQGEVPCAQPESLP